MSSVNPYGSFILQGLYGGQSSSANIFAVQNAQLTDVPTTLKNLATNLILKGEVSAQKKDGQSVISTNRGDITVKLQNPLPVGSRVDIQIPSGQSPREAIVQPTLVKAIQQKQDNQTAQIQQPQTASTATIADVKNLQTTATQATQNIGNTLSNLTIGQSVRITPLPIAQQNMLSLQNFNAATSLPLLTTTLTPLPQGTAQIVTSQQNISTQGAIVSSLLNTVQSAQKTSQLVPVRVLSAPPLTANLHASTPLISSQTPSASGHIITSTQLPPIVVQADARILSLRPPSAQIVTQSTPHHIHPALALVDPIANSGQLVATATGFIDIDGNPIIQTTNTNNQPQLSTLHYPARNLPAGTQIILTPLSSGTLNNAQGLSWQTMNQLTDIMGQVIPANTMQSILQLMPNPTQPKSFPAAALLFLAAAKGGDLSGWLGTRITRGGDDTITQLPKKFIETLMRDIATQTGRTATPSDPPMVQSNPDWRAHILPLMVGTDMHQANLWTKDDHGEHHQDDTQNKGTRFVVDLTLSRMGDVYFDGFINKDKKIFDLTVITEREITRPMQNIIKSIWYKTINGLDLDGTIIFKEIA